MVVLRRQDIGAYQLKYLIQRMGELTGKPDEAKLHINPIHPEVNCCLGNDQAFSDPEIYVVSSEVCLNSTPISLVLQGNLLWA